MTLRLLSFFIVFVCAASPVQAGLTPMENSEMEDVCGSAGVTIAIKNVQLFQYIDSFRYYANNNGILALQNIKLLNAETGGPALFNYDFGTTVTGSGLIHMDVGEPLVASVDDWNPSTATTQIYRGMTSTFAPKWDQKVAYSIGNIIFFDPNYTPNPPNPAVPIDLGSMFIGNIDIPRFTTYTSPRIGGIGYDWETTFQMTIDKIGYSYNNSCQAIQLCPTYIGKSFADATDDPRYPSSWMPNRATPVDFGDFQIGDLFGDFTNPNPLKRASNPAGIDVGETYCDLPVGWPAGYSRGMVALQLPMQGSIRFESATFAGTNFGPGAIDGINVHRLNLQLIP